MKVKRAVLLGAALLMLHGNGFARAAADVGLVNHVAGEVRYAVAGGTDTAPARSFMKVREGDRFELAAGAVVSLVYFQEARQETWRGPAAFRAGAVQGIPEGAAKPTVKALPSSVPGRLKKVPTLMRMAKLSRAGGIAVRGLTTKQKVSLEMQEQVGAARRTYEALKAQAEPTDITAELYFLTVLEEYLLYEEMARVAEQMLTKRPNDPKVQALAAWAKSKRLP